RLASAASADVRVWDVASGREKARFSKRGLHVESVAWRPNSASIAVLRYGGDVLILNDSTLEEKCSFSTQTGLTHSVAFAPNQRFVAFGDRFNMTNSGRIDIWDITNEERVGELESHQSTITTMAFSPDSSRLVFASSAHNRVWLWSIGSG